MPLEKMHAINKCLFLSSPVTRRETELVCLFIIKWWNPAGSFSWLVSVQQYCAEQEI